MIISNKKGSQIGIVMSFTIFIISLMFIFSMLSPPTKIDKNKIYSLEFLEKKVIENVSEEIGIVIVNDDLGTKGCLSLDRSSLGYSGKEFIVKDESWNEIAAGESGENIYFEKNVPNSFARIYFSESSFERSLSYTGTDCDVAKVYGVIDQNLILEEKVLELIERYEENYTSLKNALGISNSDDFSVLFVYENGTQIGDFGKDVNANIFAKTFQLKYLDLEGNKEIGEIILKVW